MKNFKNLKIWEKGIELVKLIYKLTKDLPKDEKYGLVSQITRAAVSVPSNIAEGSSRTSNKEYAYFLEIAIGSLFELETQLIIIKELKLIKPESIETILNLIDEEQKMTMSLIRKLKDIK
ncbi:MAG: four helix bundle protein [Bacteroidales bacterium]|nr:four helix bundle protein [Bacteroidales bacterium]